MESSEKERRAASEHRKGEIGVTWDPSSDQNVTTQLNVKGRGMELSDLANFNGHLLSPDDKTGMIYQIEGKKAIPWVFLNSGPGNTTSGMKAEWMTLKDGRLYVGGHGTEYRGKNGEVLSTDPMWIKIVSPSGAVEHKDWTDVYKRFVRRLVFQHRVTSLMRRCSGQTFTRNGSSFRESIPSTFMTRLRTSAEAAIC